MMVQLGIIVLSYYRGIVKLNQGKREEKMINTFFFFFFCGFLLLIHETIFSSFIAVLISSLVITSCLLLLYIIHTFYLCHIDLESMPSIYVGSLNKIIRLQNYYEMRETVILTCT